MTKKAEKLFDIIFDIYKIIFTFAMGFLGAITLKIVYEPQYLEDSIVLFIFVIVGLAITSWLFGAVLYSLYEKLNTD